MQLAAYGAQDVYLTPPAGHFFNFTYTLQRRKREYLSLFTEAELEFYVEPETDTERAALIKIFKVHVLAKKFKKSYYKNKVNQALLELFTRAQFMPGNSGYNQALGSFDALIQDEKKKQKLKQKILC